MIREQHKYCSEILKALKRHPDAGHFLEPVDPVKLNVPDYPDIIRNPMDLKTMEKKLNDCKYDIAEEFIADMRLIFDNCYLYNGKDSIVGTFAQNLERVFNNRLKKMPQGRTMTPLLDDPLPKTKPKSARRDSVEPKHTRDTSAARDARRGSNASSHSKRKVKRSLPDVHYKFCLSIVKEFHKKRHVNYAYPFLEPVDWKAMNLPDYPTIIKNPMDLSTIKKNLESGVYHNINDFEKDFRLMLENCYTYNPVNNPVYNMGKSVEKVFDSMWAHRPPLPPPSPKEPSPEPPKIESEESSSEADKDTRTQQIAEMQRHIEFMTKQLASMKDAAKDKKKEKKPKSSRAKSNSLSSRKSSTSSSKETRKRAVSDYTSDEEEIPAMTFEQKQELSDNINLLSSDKLDVVIGLIRSSMPELNEGDQDEIELDIDALDRVTLHKIYKFVKSNTEPKRSKHISKASKQEHLGGKRKRRSIPDESSSSSSGSSSGSDSDSSSSSSGSDSESSPIPPRKFPGSAPLPYRSKPQDQGC
ncbi:Bromodomain-containing protein [Basidiobolus meristosporus CBS 931.73]|uniref:Bromodomain-containing protein n=1 Tax=Basidiobolus meristosporus CBS 931.73 TaxID=1314790 RepID=A0A1Y1XDQ5_9FUNG|nr:Bromodomain-containing protein [Basidiobolus meristosporus CBS 931.73]|eukprot:ORX83855.1 Bromodomain-containing protein [Basidiobolus meristosporus CBS 931.73]